MQIGNRTLPVVVLLSLLACRTKGLGVGVGRDAAPPMDSASAHASGGEVGTDHPSEDPANLVPSVTSLPDFGSVPLGLSSAVQSFTITNIGQAASSAMDLKSSDSSFVIQSSAAGSCISGVTTLVGGASCTVGIVFTPTSAGYRAGMITFSAQSGGKGSVGATGTAPAVQGTLSIFAGLPSGEGSANGIGANAHFSSPACLAVDRSGNVFVAGTRSIRKITPDGVVTTFAGTEGLEGSADGTGADARFTNLKGVAVDTLGNVFVSDNNTIRKITATGVVTTLAGKAGTDSEGYINGTGAAARFTSPAGLAVDASGNVYVADGNEIRKVTPAGVVSTFAGTVYGGNAEGTGAQASFEYVLGVAVDTSGNVFVADTDNNKIRKITPAGVVTTLAGSGSYPEGWADGTGAAAGFSHPTGVAVDPSGNVFVADYGNHTIRKITPAGVVTTFAGSVGWPGSADGTGAEARFDWPQGVAVDSSGNVLLADNGNNTIRKITPAGVVTTLAGTAFSWDGAVDGIGTAVRFGSPGGLAVDSAGTVFVADSIGTVRKITPAEVVTTFAGVSRAIGGVDGTGAAARFDDPAGLSTDQVGNLFVADYGNHTIRKITPAGVVTTFAGAEGSPGSADGAGAAARFKNPEGVAVDRAGNVFVADNGNNTIRKITSAGVVTTLAGTAGASGSDDGTGADARFRSPMGVAVDETDDVFVADFGNNTIRKITASGVVTTFAGTAASTGDWADGVGVSARFLGPEGVAVDGTGNVWVADTFNHAIRKIAPDGQVSTVVGTVAPAILGNVPGPLPGSIVYPYSVAIDPSTGSIYIALASAVMVATFSDSGTPTEGNAGSGGLIGTGGIAGTGGTASAGGTTGSSDRFGVPCVTELDCPSNARCCDGSDPRCDGIKLPSGDGANTGEFVVSADGLTVTDSISGLLWQRDGSGTRTGCSHSTDMPDMPCSWGEADAYCNSLVLGGVSGWRLPSWIELLSILDLTKTAATPDQKAFPAAMPWSYWTSTPYSQGDALYVSFADGSTGANCPDQANVRCVRGSRCYPTSRFLVVAGGLVRDMLTGLVWKQQASPQAMTWADSQNYCSAQGSGFRLPTLKELDSLVDPAAAAGTFIDRRAFPYTGADRFWTSSPYADAASSGDMRYGDNGDSLECEYAGHKWTTVDQGLNVRCVR